MTRRHKAKRSKSKRHRIRRALRTRSRLRRRRSFHVGDKVKDRDMGEYFTAYVESVGTAGTVTVKDSSGMRIRYNRSQAKHLRRVSR